MSDEEVMERERRLFTLRGALAPILADLAKVGIAATSIEDVLRDRETFRAALPTLLLWLPRANDRDVKNAILGTLTTKWASPTAALPLIREFRDVADASGLGLRWMIGSALEKVADDTVLEQIAELAKDQTFGRAREMVTLSLGNMKSERAIDILIELLDDPEVVGHAAMALGRLRAIKARVKVERLLGHEKPWVRREAKKALAKMDRGGRSSDR